MKIGIRKNLLKGLCVEIAIAYDEQSNKYYLSSASKPIKKSFTDYSIKDFSMLISYVFEY